MKVYTIEKSVNPWDEDSVSVTEAICASRKACELYLERKVLPWYNQGGEGHTVPDLARYGYTINEVEVLTEKGLSALPADKPGA